MRRRQVDPDRQPAVPADIAVGPEVGRWASPESLQALALLPERPNTKAGREAGAEAVWACLLSARRRWGEARDEWAAEAGFTRREGMATREREIHDRFGNVTAFWQRANYLLPGHRGGGGRAGVGSWGPGGRRRSPVGG